MKTSRYLKHATFYTYAWNCEYSLLALDWPEYADDRVC